MIKGGEKYAEICGGRGVVEKKTCHNSGDGIAARVYDFLTATRGCPVWTESDYFRASLTASLGTISSLNM